MKWQHNKCSLIADEWKHETDLNCKSNVGALNLVHSFIFNVAFTWNRSPKEKTMWSPRHGWLGKELIAWSLNFTVSTNEMAQLNPQCRVHPYVAVPCTKEQPLIVFIFFCLEFDPINNAGCNDISNVLINNSVAAIIAKTSLILFIWCMRYERCFKDAK